MEVGVFLTEPRRYSKPSLLGFNFYVCHFAGGKIQLYIFLEGGGMLSNSVIQPSARYIHENSEHFLINSSLKCYCLHTVHQASCPVHNPCSMFPWVNQLSSLKSLWNKHL